MSSTPNVSSTVSLLPGMVVLDRYRIEGLIGEGGMGSVYEAVNTLTEKHVALKWLRGGAQRDDAVRRRRLLREARLASRVEHPNVINIFDVGEENGNVFLVMELLRGRSLSQWMREHSPLDPAAFLALFVPALHGLSALHAAGIIHRDLKPHNIFLVEDEHGNVLQAKLLDFGLALELEGQSATLTASGAVVGTPAYMAPEQLEGPDVDARSDVYACGVVMYEALSGRLPFEGQNLARLLKAVLDDEVVPLSTRRPEIPAALSGAIMRALARKPENRFQTVASLIAALAPHTPSGPVLVAATRARRRPRSERWLWVVAALTIAVLGGALYWRTMTGSAISAEPSPPEIVPAPIAAPPAAEPPVTAHETSIAAPAPAPTLAPAPEPPEEPVAPRPPRRARRPQRGDSTEASPRPAESSSERREPSALRPLDTSQF